MRGSFAEWATTVDPSSLHFIDETGSHIAMTRHFGRAMCGQRVAESVPRNRGTVTTVVGSLSLRGIEAVTTFVGGTTGDRFLDYVNEQLLPTLKPGDFVVLDRLGAHRDARVRAAIEKAGASIVFLPPYSPDMNPIEFAWAHVKAFLRSAKARTVDALLGAIAEACANVHANHAASYIRHCGFRSES